MTQVTIVKAGLPTPSLPRRVNELARAVGTVQHPGQPTRYNLPVGWSMSEEEKREASSACSTLTRLLEVNASFQGQSASDARLALVTMIVSGMAVGQSSETAAGAKLELYMIAVDDLPAWSIADAIRLWAKGECPADVEKSPVFKYAPSPATLRGIALAQIAPYRDSLRLVTNLLAAVPVERAMDPEPLPKSFGVVGPALRRM